MLTISVSFKTLQKTSYNTREKYRNYGTQSLDNWLFFWGTKSCLGNRNNKWAEREEKSWESRKREIDFENPSQWSHVLPFSLVLTISASCSYELAGQYWFIDHPPLDKLAWEQKQMQEKRGQGHLVVLYHVQTDSCCESICINLLFWSSFLPFRDFCIAVKITRNVTSSCNHGFYPFFWALNQKALNFTGYEHTCHQPPS